MSLIEVFKLTPTVGRHYLAALADRNISKRKWTSKGYHYEYQYFVNKNELRYVGVYVKSKKYGFSDGTTYEEYFNKNSELVKLTYDYDCRVCLLEVKAEDILNYNSPSAVPIDQQLQIVTNS
jgi:hypothetical protein